MAAADDEQSNEIHLLGERLIIVAASGELHPARIAAQTCHFRGEVGIDAFTRILHVVDRVVDQRSADRRLGPSALIVDRVADETGEITYGWGRRGRTIAAIAVFLRSIIIRKLRREVLRDRQAEPDRAAGDLA